MILDPRDERRCAPVFLLAPAGGGKTRHCLDRLLELEEEGRPSFYLVPEQSTYLADRQLLEPPGPQAIRHVCVLSFRRLAHLLKDRAGRATTRSLDRAGRRILLRRLVAELPAELRRPFEGIFDRPGFIESLAAILRDLRHEAGPTDLDRLEQAGPLPEALRMKLRMLTFLRSAYDEALAARGLHDPDLLLLETPVRIRDAAERYRGLPVFVDGFLSFTRLETEILIALAGSGASLTITLCLDKGMTEGVDLLPAGPPPFRIREWPSDLLAGVSRPAFLAPLRTFLELRARFHAAGIPTRTGSPEMAGRAVRFHSSDLGRLEASILARGKGWSGTPSDIELAAARDPSHEVEIWARQIDRWIRLDPSPVRPGEIAVIVRDLDVYRPLVAETFARFHIPVFIDRHWDITSRPLVRTILDAFEVLRSGWQRETVIAFLRSSLLGVRPGEVDLVENLALEAGYDYDRWTGAPWEPIRRLARAQYIRGDEESSEEEANDEPALSIEASEPREERIERVRTEIGNRLRSDHLASLEAFGSAWDSGAINGREAVAGLRRWIADCGLRERSAKRDAARSAEAAREWEAIDQVLEQVAEETASESLSLESFARLLLTGLDSLRLGRTPTGLDRVTLAEVHRSRLGEVRRAIVGGLSARDFPRSSTSGRFLNEMERRLLTSVGLDLGTPEPMIQEEEAYLFYIALTRASEKLLLTRSATDLEGHSLDPSPFVHEIQHALPGLRERTPILEEDPGDLDEVQTGEELAAHIGAYIAARLDRRVSGIRPESDRREKDPSDRRILTAYNRLVKRRSVGDPLAGRDLLVPSSRLWGYENRPHLPDRLMRLVRRGTSLATSAGRMESFARCPYQHFARHLLRLEPRPRSEVTPLENGLLAHRALEILYAEGPPPSDRRKIDERLGPVFERLMDDERLRAYRVDPSGRFRMRAARGQLLRFLEVEARRLGESAFQPDRFEQEFGTRSIPPLRIPLVTGGELLLRGRIDRIDRGEIEGATEALVLDYKSTDPYGTQRGRPQDVDEGFDLQMAVYLLVAEEILGLPVAGGLYVPVLPRPSSRPPTDPRNPLDIKMIGLLAENRREWITGSLNLIRTLRDRRNRLADREELRSLLDRARSILATFGEAITRGRIDIAPVERGGRLPCANCDFAPLCRIEEAYNPPRRSPLEGLNPAER